MPSGRVVRAVVLLLAVAVLPVRAAWAAGEGGPALRSYPADHAQPGRLVVHSYPLNPYNRALDGQWECSTVASDGNCYFASSTHSFSVGSAFFKYDPEKREMTCLCENDQKLAGPLGTPREKLHSDIDEANGWLYFASKEGSPGPGQKGGGGVLLGYELATGKFRNYGVVQPGRMIYSGIGADAKHNQLWAITSGGRQSQLLRIDLNTGEKTSIGSPLPGDACFYMFVDAQGDCWFTIRGGRGTLYRARAADGKLDQFDKALPEGADWWSWAQPLADGKRCVLLAEPGVTPSERSPDKFWIFDSTKAAGPEAFKPVKTVGVCGLGNAVAGSRVYFVQRPGGRGWVPGSGGGGDKDLRLHSLALDGDGEPQVVNHGIIVDQDGRYPMRIHALSADEKGRVYMTGDWWLLPGEKGTDKSTDRVGQGILNRGQFFAVADVSATVEKGGGKTPAGSEEKR